DPPPRSARTRLAEGYAACRRLRRIESVKALWFTTDEEACRLLASDPFALLVGFALDQQVTVPTAFAGPQKIKQRLGTLDPKVIARTDLTEVFRQKPAVHRFPGAMAQRVQDLAQ